MSKRLYWKLKNREIVLGERTLVVGVLNVTPDSFSDGGDYADPDRAVERALELEQQGADIIDIGAESTRPDSERINEGEELRRLVPVLKRLKDKLSIPISVDTYKAAVAEKALEHGAEIINDPSGVLWDLAIAKVVTKWDAGLIVNHMRGTPETWSSLGPIKHLMRSVVIDLEAALSRAKNGGVQRHQLVVDPGLGFGKRREQNSEILAALGSLRQFDLPILVGPSRKGFLKKDDPLLTEFATAAAVTASVMNGAHMVRVHDVPAARAALEVVDAIRAAAERAAEALEAAQEASSPRKQARPSRDDRSQAPPIPRPQTRVEAKEPEGGGFERPTRERRDEPSFDRPKRSNFDRPVRHDDAPPRFAPRSPRPEAGPKRFDREQPPRSVDTGARDNGKPFRGTAKPFRSDDRPPRRDARPFGGDDRPTRRDTRPPRSGDDRPPRRDARPSAGAERPPRRDARPSAGAERPPRRDARSPRAGDDRPPRRSAGPIRSDDRPKRYSDKAAGASDRPPRFAGKPARGSDGPPRPTKRPAPRSKRQRP